MVNRLPVDEDSEQSLRTIAIHEAGHVIACVAYGIEQHGIELDGAEPRQRPPHSTTFDVQTIAGKGEDAGLPHIVVALAGLVAEDLFVHRVSEGDHDPDVDPLSLEDALDGERIAAIAIRGIGDPDEGDEQRIEALTARGWGTAESLVITHPEAFLAITNALLLGRSVTRDEVIAALKTHPPASLN